MREQGDYIEARAARLDNVMPGRFVAYIVEWWFSKGCPPVTEFESFLKERGQLLEWKETVPKIGTTVGPKMGEATTDKRKTRHTAATGKSE
jgi:hypothetical protein